MTDRGTQTTARLDVAGRRLEKAVESMEAAALARVEAALARERDITCELERLQADSRVGAEALSAARSAQQALAQELESARTQNLSLREVNEAVSDRLDAAIARIRSLLEG